LNISFLFVNSKEKRIYLCRKGEKGREKGGEKEKEKRKRKILV
jgi:hypothetical protein